MEIAVRSYTSVDAFAVRQDTISLFKRINDNPLIDRLYRRYVRREDNVQTLDVLREKATLISEPLLNCLIEKLEDGIKGSELSLKTFGGEYCPIRLCIHDVFYAMVEEEIPLEDYDNLEGDPLWMRPEYMIEKYG